MTPTLIEQFKSARRVSTPLIAITTPDPNATIIAICDAIKSETPMVQWDIVSGYKSRSEAGKNEILRISGDGSYDQSEGNPLNAIKLALKFKKSTLVFIHMASRWLVDPMVIQAVWSLRDEYKRDRRTLVMLSPSFDLPPELSGDVVVFDEPLPDAAALTNIVSACFKSAGLDEEKSTEKAIEALQGLPAFQAEQVTAMSLTKSGLNIDALWERKRRQIELTPGLKVHRGSENFQAIGGVSVVKDFIGRILQGQEHPNTVVFIDEIEKMMGSGTSGGGDTSGVSQDQLGALLTYMQDQSATGMIFIGPPGSAKSMVAKAAGNEGGVPTIQLDLGGLKGSLVGQSEQQLRNALKVVTSVSNSRSLWIATCNNIRELPPELRRRFTLGTFFFDLPSPEEREAIWSIYLNQYGHDSTEIGRAHV